MVEVRERPWRSIVPRKVQRSFDAVLKHMDSLSPKIQQYEAFQNMKELSRKYKTSMLLLSELRSDALKDRHWRQVKKILLLQHKTDNQLLLSDLLDAPLKSSDKVLKDILLRAQGEMALEQFMSDVRDGWNAMQLELVDYQNKTSLIRGWDELFTKLDDHLSSLNSMKQSPYFKVFEDDAKSWEEKLTKLRVLFDIWIDVQRRWVYLEGIFYGSADIKQQLPNEFARFKSIDQEFVQLMRNVRYKPNVLNVLSLTNVQRTLERLSDLLDKIQRALGAYLERQRAGFPRFYFVGDEDLLEIIGNSKDPVQVQRHVGKMFAAIATLDIDVGSAEGGGHRVVGMVSREGETVPYDEPVDVSKLKKINEWLGGVETQMQRSLAALLEKSVGALPVSVSNKSGGNPFLTWAHQYPAQIVLLASSVNWSNTVEHALLRTGTATGTATGAATGAAAGTAAAASVAAADLSTQVLPNILFVLTMLADQVLASDLDPSRRKTYEQLITDFVHQRDATRRLIKDEASSPEDFAWVYQLRYYWKPAEAQLMHRLSIKVANASFHYGFEYLGVAERLVQTPLTDRCYLTLTQALHMRMGGNPFGECGCGWVGVGGCWHYSFFSDFR